ncbi:MAG TPA: phosphohistidine phosphatase SixA [Gemmatimonadaceae bacterium]|nr:phosphohistidine phosphatase SixA [Gemmatimonadaceae bacterium]
MQLLVIRHAIAEDRDEFAESGQDDSERPLTRVGRRRMRRNARGLRRIGPTLDVIATSPFVRAAETARIVANTLGYKSEIVTVDALTPEQAPEALLSWLMTHPAEANVAVVGHEPHLGRLVTWLMTGVTDAHVVFKKGGACLLDLGVRPSAGGALMHWLLTPSHLRAIGD